MKNPPQRLLSILAMLLVLSAVAYGSPCTVPSDPGCAPNFNMTWAIQGQGPTHNVPTGPAYWNPLGYWEVDFTPQNLGSYSFTGGQLNTNADAFLSFSYGVINNTSNTSLIFNYDFTTPFINGPNYLAEMFFSDSLLHTKFDGLNSMVAPYLSIGWTWPYISNSFVNGVLIPNFEFGVGCTTSLSTHNCSSPDDGALMEHYLTGATGTLEVKGQFIISPNSNYSLNGETDLVPIPEPGSLLLLGTSIAGVAGILRRTLHG